MKLIALLAATLTIGCGSQMQPTGPSQPAPVFTSSTQAGTSSARTVSRYSCPDGSTPQNLIANTKDGGVTFFWDAVEAISEYHFEVDRLGQTGYATVDRFSTSKPDFSWRILEQGRHRVRVRTSSACNTLGPWSAYAYFGEGDDAPSGPGHVEPQPCVGTPNFCYPDGTHRPTPWLEPQPHTRWPDQE